MHVLQLLPELTVGGVERGVLDLSRGLLARGHRVSVVSCGGPLVERLTQLGVMHYHLPVHQKSLLAIGSCVPAIAQMIQTTGVDVVHARSRVPAWSGFFASRIAQKPFVTTAHGFYRPNLGSRVMTWGRSVIVPSQALADYLVEHFHLPPSRLRIIPRGVDLKEFLFQPPSQDPQRIWRIGLFGRLSPIKGHAVAIEACAQLRREGILLELVFAGPSKDLPQNHSLRQLIHRLKMQDAVTWLGLRQDIQSLIASVDLVIVPSIYPESFGRGVIEAQAVGRPVVASRMGALCELIDDGQTGLLVPPGNGQALAQAIRRLITDSQLRARCIQAARVRVERDWAVERMVERTLDVYEECLTRPRIVVWKLSALGDVILATASLRAIRRQFPQARIALVVGRSAYEVVARCPYLDDFIITDSTSSRHRLREFFKLLQRLRRQAYDLSIDLQNSRMTHGLAWLAGIPVRVGYARKGGWMLNRRVRLPKVVLTPVAHQHHLLRQAGIAPDGEALELWPSGLEEARAQRLLPGSQSIEFGHSPLIGLHPGGSLRWKTKRWDLMRWASLCDALAKRQYRVLVTGGPDEVDLGEALTHKTNAPVRNVIGQTSLMELACLIKRCDVFVAHDYSTLHLAAAMGTPTVALFGPTDPRRHLPPLFRGTVLKKDVFCSPCYSPRCRTVTHACMKRISVDEVLDAIEALVGSSRAVNPQSAIRNPQ